MVVRYADESVSERVHADMSASGNDQLEVVGPVAKGIAAGEFDELVTALRAGRAYANVHSTKFPSGEIRGQINDDNQRDD